MAARFGLACAACLLYDIFGMKYDRYHNHGIGPVLFASICTMSAGYEPMALPEHDTGHKIIVLSLIIWPGSLWGMALFALFTASKDVASSMWLILCPLFVILLGLPVLANHLPAPGPLRNWRVGTGLSSIGILIGHFLSQSNVGHTIEEQFTDLLSSFAVPTTFKAMTGAAVMLVSMARMVQNHSQAAKATQLTKETSRASIYTEGLPPFWGMQGPTCVATWTTGLTICVSVLDEPQARAMLVSTNVAIFLTMATIPPSSGRIWGLPFDTSIRLLSNLHAAQVCVYGLYFMLVARGKIS